MRGKGFELDPYDPCVANAIIGGKHMTVCCHVDYLKVSHVDPKKVTNSIEARGLNSTPMTHVLRMQLLEGSK